MTSKKKQLIKNSSIGLVQLILTAILTLISVPVFIQNLSLELYGVFAIVSVVGNLQIFTSLGLNQALIVYLAKQGKCKESDYDIFVTGFLFFSFTLLFSSLVIFFRHLIITNILSVPTQFVQDAEKLLIYLVLANGILLIGQVFTSIIDASQKIFITNICQFGYSVVYWGGIITVVSLGGELPIVGKIILGASIFWFVLVGFFGVRIWGSINLNGIGTNFIGVLKKQLGYGSKIYLSGLVGFMFEPLSKILISNFIGLQLVGVFEIAIKIRGQISALLTKAFYPLFPFMADSEDGNKLNELVNDISRKIQLIVIPAIFIVIFTMPILVELWLGNENVEQISFFIITLTSSLLLLSPSVLPVYQFFVAKNLAQINIYSQLSSVITNLVIFLILFQFLGAYTIIISNGLAYFASFLILRTFQSKYTNNRFNKPYFYRQTILIFLILVPCLIISSFELGYFSLVLYPLLISSVFIMGIRFLGIIKPNDLVRYFDSMPKFERYLNKILISNNLKTTL